MTKKPAFARQRSKNPPTRLLVIAGVIGGVVLAALVLWYSSLPNNAAKNGVSGDNAAESSDKIPVREIFSYACYHCRDFDPIVQKWKKTLPNDVDFQQVAFGGGNRLWISLARVYYAMQELDLLDTNHQRLFEGLHDRGLNLITVRAVANFITLDDSTSAEEFQAVAQGEKVAEAMEQANRLARRHKVSSVPTMVVADRFVVTPENKSFREVLARVDELIERERIDRQQN